MSASDRLTLVLRGAVVAMALAILYSPVVVAWVLSRVLDAFAGAMRVRG